ncbi:hypothetical protein AUI46_07175 [archaeon 13_1_40CM_2_52_13]|nr:MAG: hypothetical protein AUI46_07175 [archaeon 13_1_40CM_2_52_13]OLE68379.1 MAG: hypothetical protein AUF78_16490 [archaeon 13_1_20CM_2_51_12]TMI39747.1 MAG: hypothetical protein E6H21_08330 [Candidatus Bathyarchaeota archaeon]
MSLAEAAKPALPSSTLRSYAMIGIVLYAFGLVLDEIGNGLAQVWLVPYADTISALGFVIALYTASLAGLGTRLTVLIGLIYGIGFFYVSEPDATYAASGLKISSYNTTHFIGLGLIGFTMIVLIALAFYLTRAKSAHRALPKQDPGSTN